MVGSAVGVLIVWLLFFNASICEAQSPSVRIEPNDSDEKVFEGTSFRRNCRVVNVNDDVTVRITWMRDGRRTDTLDNRFQLQLRIDEATESRAGHYMCRVELFSNSGSVVFNMSVNGGRLTVLGRSSISAPNPQVIVEGSNGSLNCSYPNALIAWFASDESIIRNNFNEVTLDNEGVYMCDIFYLQDGPSIQIPIQLYVVLPIEILSKHQTLSLTRNEGVVLAVEFRGRDSHGLMITWMHNDIGIATTDPRIHNTFNSEAGTGRTELRLALARRSDAGLYHVRISNQVGPEQGTPTFTSQDEATLQLNITVLPSAPVELRVDQVSSVTSRVSWSPSNRTLDEGADELILKVTFSNHSLAACLRLSGDATSRILSDLLPAHNYSVMLTAINGDGEVTTNSVSFRTDNGPPAITNLNVQRRNETFFVLSVGVAYNGGGSISQVDVSYKRRGTSGNLKPLNVMEFDEVSAREVIITVLLEQQVSVEHEALMELTFVVVLTNKFGYVSTPVSSNVSAYEARTTPPTTVATASATTPSLYTRELLPLWLIAVIASVVTILIILMLVACIVAVFVCCRTKKSDKYKVEVEPPTTLNANENGIGSVKSSGSLQGEEFRGRSESSSLPCENYTSSLEEIKKHKRELSECSSVGMSKVTITPCTTASNSPSNFSKGRFLNSQEKGLDSITELERASRGSNDSGTESERDRLRPHHKKLLSTSPCSRNNLLNSQYMQIAVQQGSIEGDMDARGHADGSVCASSHHSLVSSGHPSCHSLKHFQTPSRRFGAEYMYSDCESVASTDVSCSNISLSSSYNTTQLRPVQYRSPTPYNHDYPLIEGSVV